MAIVSCRRGLTVVAVLCNLRSGNENRNVSIGTKTDGG